MIRLLILSLLSLLAATAMAAGDPTPTAPRAAAPT